MSNGHFVATVLSDRMRVFTMPKVPIFSLASNPEEPDKQVHAHRRVKDILLYHSRNGIQL
jgi:hypothetical protein